MRDLRIVYIGTPEFAVASLKILVENSYNIVAVITAPDKPKGRGQKVAISPVKEYALQNNIPVLQPKNLKDPDFIEALRNYNANLQIVVAFRMLPEMVWNMPEIGTFNLHASLLPQYRGAAPINWAIINGEKETGVTTFFLKHKIDTGEIIFQEKEPIYEDDTVGDLYERLMSKGAKLVLKTVKAIEEDNCQLMSQNENQELRSAPKIFRDTCEINWAQSGAIVQNFIRGLSPYPAAWTYLKGKTVKIFRASSIPLDDGLKAVQPGEFTTDGKTYLRFRALDVGLQVYDLQIQGKKRMLVEDFLKGAKL